MRARLHLDLRHDAVFDDPGDDAREMVARRPADGGFGLGVSWGRRHETRELPPVHGPLPPGRPHGDQPAIVGEAAHAVDADAKQFGDLTDFVGSDAETLAFARFIGNNPRKSGSASVCARRQVEWKRPPDADASSSPTRRAIVSASWMPANDHEEARSQSHPRQDRR